MQNAKWIDISATIKSGMVHWPGDPAVRIRRLNNMDKGDSNNVSLLTMTSHTGTHMDAPLHFFKNGKSLHKMPFEATIGPAQVICINDKVSITPGELRRYNIRRGERILFKTANSQRCWKTNRFIKDFVYISKEAAKYLTKVNVRMIGVDYLSVGGDISVHHLLLKSGIWIIEGLDLSSVKKGRYDLICLPLKILNSDGAPARAMVRCRR